MPATLNISDIIVQDSSTSTFGSGIAIFDWGTNGLHVNISNCVVKNNTVVASSGGGPAGIYVDNLGGPIDVSISKCQILDNSAELDGSGLYIDSGEGDVTLVNNVIAGNTIANDNEVDIKNNDFDTTQDSGFYIESAVNLSLGDNLDDVDPLFDDAANNDYHLTAQSPVIDMGNNSAPAVPSDDLDSNPRPVNGTVDMGACEFQDGTTPSTTTTLPGGTTTTSTTTTTTTTLPGSTTTTTVPSGGGGGGGGGCFINTAGTWRL